MMHNVPRDPVTGENLRSKGARFNRWQAKLRHKAELMLADAHCCQCRRRLTLEADEPNQAHLTPDDRLACPECIRSVQRSFRELRPVEGGGA